MPIRIPRTIRKRNTVRYKDARGVSRMVTVLGVATNAAKSVTVTTTSGSPNIIATVGTFDTTGLDVQAAVSGNNTNTGAGRKILSVTDSTHAVMDGNAAATDAVGTATTLTRRMVKIRFAHRPTKVVDDVGTAVLVHGVGTHSRY